LKILKKKNKKKNIKKIIVGIMIFKNRYDAAMRLIPLLNKYKNEEGIVLAVPRGGVPIGYYIAKAYNLPLELLLTKKIGHPVNSELAIGAVSIDEQIIDDRFNIPEAYIENETKKIRESLKERNKKFMGNRKPLEVKNKIVIIVDDGIATGNTLLAAIQMMKQKKAKKIIIAVPVAPYETANKIKEQVDDFICLYAPEDFWGVGQFYDDFSQVSDEEVIRLINEVNGLENAA
jgi:putative phosphoribosyl transferase